MASISAVGFVKIAGITQRALTATNARVNSTDLETNHLTPLMSASVSGFFFSKIFNFNLFQHVNVTNFFQLETAKRGLGNVSVAWSSNRPIVIHAVTVTTGIPTADPVIVT